MVRYLFRGKKSKYVLLAVALIAVIVFCATFDFIQAYLLGLLADAALGKSEWAFWQLAVFSLSFLFGLFLFNWLFVLLSNHLLKRIRASLTEDLLAAISAKEVSWLKDNSSPSEIISTFTDQLEKLMDGYFYVLITIFSMAVSFVFSTVYLCFLSPWFLLPLLGLCLLNYLVYLLTKSKSKSNMSTYVSANKTYVKALDGFSLFLSTACMFSFAGRLQQHVLAAGQKFNDAKTSATSYSEFIKRVNSFTAILSVFAVGLIAVGIRESSSLTAGNFLALIQIWGSICTPFFSFSWLVGSLFSTSDIRKKIKSLLDETKKKKPIESLDRLVVKDLSFSYEEKGKPIFSHLNFCIDTNGIFLIQGASGRGKTTLASIILKELSPSSGEVLVNGTSPLSDCSDDSYFHFVKALPQTPILYDGGLKENIVLGAPFDEKRYQTICEALHFSPSLSLRGEGFAELDHNDGNLSLGELRRVGFARLMYADSSWVVLDEPFASLDPENIDILCQNILSMAKDRKVILISHEIPKSISDVAKTVVSL